MHSWVRLSDLTDSLGSYPELHGVIMDVRLGSMTTSAVHSSLTDAMTWYAYYFLCFSGNLLSFIKSCVNLFLKWKRIADLEAHVQSELDNEESKQDEILELQRWACEKGWY